MFVSTPYPNSHTETLTPNVMVSVVGPWVVIRVNESMRMGPA